MIDRKQLKFAARGYMKAAKPSPWTVSMIACIITLILSVLSTQVTNLPAMQAALTEYYQTLDMEAYIAAMQAAQPDFAAMLINLLLGFMSTMIGAGLIIFIMRTVRDHKGSVGNLLDAFPVLIRIFCYQVVSSVLIFLWALLFIIPGIIASYRYRQGLYLLLDHPEMGIMDCIRTSKNLMDGHKWELFVMDLSFLLWNLAVAVLSSALGSLMLHTIEINADLLDAVLSSALGILMPLLFVELLVLPLSAFVTIYTGISYFLYYEALHGATYDSRISSEGSAPADSDFSA